jgi:cytochrome c oxidase subunit 3
MRQYKADGKIKDAQAVSISERMGPQRTFLFFALIGSSILFLSLVIMFIIWMSYHPPIENLRMPKAFVVSTIILLFSSYLLTLARRAFQTDNSKTLLISLSSTLVLSAAFTFLQVNGWKELYDSGHFFDGAAGVTFLYLITGLHFVHVFGGIIYLLYLNLVAFDTWQDPVKSLIYFSNPVEGIRLEIFSAYWHFLDGLWLFLFLTFLFTL